MSGNSSAKQVWNYRILDVRPLGVMPLLTDVIKCLDEEGLYDEPLLTVYDKQDYFFTISKELSPASLNYLRGKGYDIEPVEN